MNFQRPEEKLDHCKIRMYFYCVCGCVLEFKFYLEIIVLDLIKIYVNKRVLLSALGPK